MEIEIGRGKSGRRAYGLDDIAIVPSRRTRDAEDVDIGWEFGPFRFELPMLASAMDAVVDVKNAERIGRLGGLAVLNLEGLQTRYENPDEVFEEIALLPVSEATRGIQRVYQEPIKPEPAKASMPAPRAAVSAVSVIDTGRPVISALICLHNGLRDPPPTVRISNKPSPMRII